MDRDILELLENYEDPRINDEHPILKMMISKPN